MATVRAAPAFWRVHVFGTNGSAEARGEDTVILAPIGSQPETRLYEHVDPVRTLVEKFADTVEGKGRFPITPSQILDMLGAFEAVLASLQSGGPATVPEMPPGNGAW
jgi:hypothetical protein